MVKVREVCKEGSKLVDDNRIFWRIFWRILDLEPSIWRRNEVEEILRFQRLPARRSLQQTQSIIEQFDNKRGSTLEKVMIELKPKEYNAEITQISQVLRKSKQTLLLVEIRGTSAGTLGFRNLVTSLLTGLSNLVDFRLTDGTSRIKFSIKTQRDSEVFRFSGFRVFPFSQPNSALLFKTLTSFRLERDAEEFTCGETQGTGHPLRILLR